MSDNLLHFRDITADVYKKISPMMRQYLDVKQKNGDCIIMYRLGDFYEMFFDDAILVSSVLGLTLTGRDCGLEARAPMCGVPYHALQKYMKELIEKGYRIAICEQMTDPALAKGLVDRAVTRIVTPGTVTEEDVLDEKSHNYIFSVYLDKSGAGYAYADISTGSFFAGEFGDKNAFDALLSEMNLLSPKEVIYPQTMANGTAESYTKINGIYYTHAHSDKAFDFKRSASHLMNHFRAASLTALGIADMEHAVRSAGALLSYLGETQMNTLRHVTHLTVAAPDGYMKLDDFTRNNLELVAPLRRDSAKSVTLLSTIDCTHTAMGGRMIKDWVLRPLLKKTDIEYRLEGVSELYSSVMLTDELRESLRGMCDIERLCSKLSSNALNPKNCVALKYALQKLWQIKQSMEEVTSPALRDIYKGIDTLDDLCAMIDAAIVDDPPLNVRDGGAIKTGFDAVVDKYRDMSGSGRQWLSELEAKERNLTGIKTLKIGYNKVFGYFFEVSKSLIGQVPERFIRKQTLANAERYFTAELKALEEQALSSEEKCIEREVLIFSGIQDAVTGALSQLQKNAELTARLDCLLSYAKTAQKYNYVRPKINEDGRIEVMQGRHPMVEVGMKEPFNPNDIVMNNETDRALIITGPNMAGKSTYMRQAALIVLMAHIGCFVPAESADICVTDRIFTRVGASDNLASGQSTFMVEMSEMACILNSATENSLLILDEIGRGTATYDGLSIARATLEYIAQTTRAKTLFATHYHELIEMEDDFPCIKNYSVAVKEIGDNIVFLHKIVKGGADKSFGIQVAALAGLPESVVARAKIVLREHEGLLSVAKGKIDTESDEQREHNLIANEIYDEIDGLDPEELSPKEALRILFKLKEYVK